MQARASLKCKVCSGNERKKQLLRRKHGTVICSTEGRAKQSQALHPSLSVYSDGSIMKKSEKCLRTQAEVKQNTTGRGWLLNYAI